MYYQCFNRTGLQGYLPSEAVISGAHAICMVPLTCKSTNVFERQLRHLRHQRVELTQFVARRICQRWDCRHAQRADLNHERSVTQIFVRRTNYFMGVVSVVRGRTVRRGL